jgi:hypothetical protein
MVWATLLMTAVFTFLDYWAYSRVQHDNPVAWQKLATGQGIAPAQYRIGVYFTANFLAHATHLQLRHIFAAADFFCTGASLAVVLFLLTRLPVFRERENQSQWAIVFLALLLTQFYLAWTLWFQEPETMPSFAILVASALLCSGLLRVPRGMLAVSLLLVALLGATIRFDAVLAFHAGMLLAALVTADVPLGRAWQIGTSVLAVVLALGVEYFVAHSMFPLAPREAALLQVVNNLHSLNGMFVLLLSLPGWALTVYLAPRYWRGMNGWGRGLLIGSVIHFAMFLTLGMSEEVRIFIPFALLTLPLGVPWLFDWCRGASEGLVP